MARSPGCGPRPPGARPLRLPRPRTARCRALIPSTRGCSAATTDARMVRWWWTNRPSAPIVLATGGPRPLRGGVCPPPRRPAPWPTL
ncbi:bifunctional DNA primase/polymerase [Streptomyces sp. PG2]